MLSERSCGGDSPIDKVSVEKYPNYLSRQGWFPTYIAPILASICWSDNRIRNLLLNDKTLRSLLLAEERKTIIETAER
jgi:hypothetical protein